MLVLTRKIDEEIMIGDDIKVTLIRVRGNTVRIGIEAPRDVRIVRGELEKLDTDVEATGQLSDREQAFAHPQATKKQKRATSSVPQNRLPKTTPAKNLASVTEPKLYVGKVTRNGDSVKLSRAPLADFVAAS